MSSIGFNSNGSENKAENMFARKNSQKSGLSTSLGMRNKKSANGRKDSSNLGQSEKILNGMSR